MDYCGGCWGSWTLCNDTTYVHKPNKKKDKQNHPTENYSGGWTEAPWTEDVGSWNRTSSRKSPRRRTQSPRQRSSSVRGRTGHQKGEDQQDGAGGKGAKGGAVAFGHLPPSTTWLTPPAMPFSQEPATSVTASTSTAMQPFGKARAEKEDAELQALRHLHAQVRGQSGEQSEEVKKALAVLEASIRKDDAKSYKQLIYLLTQARKKLSDIEEQWDAFRSQWTAYLDTATKMWTSHIDSYEEGETKFSQKRKEAAEHLQQVRTQLHEIHVRTMSVEGTVPQGQLQEGQTALDDTMMIADMDVISEQPQFMQLKTELHRRKDGEKKTHHRKSSRRRSRDPGASGISNALTLHASSKEAKRSDSSDHSAWRGEGLLARRTKMRRLAFWPRVTAVHLHGQVSQEPCSLFSTSDAGVETRSRNTQFGLIEWLHPPPHSVLEEPDFVSVWDAQTRALLLEHSLASPLLAPHLDAIFFENFINDSKHPVPIEDLIELGIKSTLRNISQPAYEETQDGDMQISTFDAPCFGPCHDRPDPNEVPNFADPPSDSDGSGHRGHQRQDRRPPLRHFPAWVTDLWHLIQEEGATELLEEGPVMYLGSYYLSHETCTRQEEKRPVRLDRHYESWAQQIVQVWHDHFDHSLGFETPPCSAGASHTFDSRHHWSSFDCAAPSQRPSSSPDHDCT